MNFFDQLVIPPSPSHVALLNVIQILAFLIFLPFTGMLAGGSLLSIYFNYLGKKTKNELYIRFSKDIIDKLSISRNAGYAVGMLPVMTILFVYAQFLYGAKVISVNMLLLSALLFIASYIILYNYKNTFHLEKILNSFKSLLNPDIAKIPAGAKEYERKIIESNSRYGHMGTFVLYVATFLFIGSTTIASDSQSWSQVNNILGLLVSGRIWLNYLYFLSTSFAITGGAILFFFFAWQGGINDLTEEFRNLIKKYSVSLALTGTLLQPIFLFTNIIFLPRESMSSYVYIYSGLALLCVLIVCNLLYVIFKDSKINYSGAVFFIMLLTFSFTIVKDQLIFGNAVKDHLKTVFAKSDELEKETIALVTASGTKGINPEEIFNAKCSACHRFDVKLVGPPYQQTVPKYNGDVNKLSEFIYNPVKVNADYPPMPNQGLKKKEADAMAQWLITKIGKK